MHLADMGADVIKIEDTGAGDYAAPGLRGLVHRNKRALCLQLKTDEGVAVLHSLVATADVIVESFRPGVMERLGVGYDALSRINPRIVYCSITGYGQTGPYRDEPGHDLNYCAMTGVSDQIGRAGDPPALSNIPIADLLGGSLTSAMGILAALFDAQRTGIGRHVDIAMADAMLAHTVIPMLTLVTQGHTRPAGADKLSGALPWYSIYRTQDERHLAVGALERKFWERFCEVLGRDDLKPFHSQNDAAALKWVRDEVATLIGAAPLADWWRRFEGQNCCVTPVLRLEESLEEPQFQARGMVIPGDASTGGRQFGCPVQMSGYRFEVYRPAPEPGQHSDEILTEAGYDEDARAALRRNGVIA